MTYPSAEEVEQALVARTSKELVAQLRQARVAIAGLGGLGSHVAMMLTRAGVGYLHLVDFDVVDLSNLNRQAYSLEYLGVPKTQALRSLLLKINPYMGISCEQVRVDEQNAATIFGEYPFVCEAFDDPTQKAMLVTTLLGQCEQMRVVSASGLAGYGPANEVRTREVFSRLVLCGDACSELESDSPLVASRVMLCAAHQAHAILRLILGKPAC